MSRRYYIYCFFLILIGTPFNLFGQDDVTSDTHTNKVYPKIENSFIVAVPVEVPFGFEEINYLQKAQLRLEEARSISNFSTYVSSIRYLADIDLTPDQPNFYKSNFSNAPIELGSKKQTFAIFRFDLLASVQNPLPGWLKEQKILYYEPNYLSQLFYNTASTYEVMAGAYENYIESSCINTLPNECHLRYSQLELVKAFEEMKEVPLTSSPVIAVLDSGVDFQHPALIDNLWKNNSNQKNQSGCLNDIYGCDTTQASDDSLGTGNVYPTGTSGPGLSCPPLGEQGGNCIHGSHIAGIISNKTEDSDTESFPGVCPSCKVLSVKIVGPTKDGTNNGKYSIADSSIIAALVYIENFSKNVKPVRVINASFGKFHPSETVKRILDRIRENGTLIIAASGNETSAKKSYPAAFKGVMGVSNISKVDYKKHENSNYGDWVDISAPGSGLSGIYSTLPGETFLPLTGTSMAAPMVSGVAGLILAKYPNISLEELEKRILDGADKSMYNVAENKKFIIYPSGSSSPTYLLGRGSLNAYNAISGTVGNGIKNPMRSIENGCGVIQGYSFLGSNSLNLVMLFLPFLVILYRRKN